MSYALGIRTDEGLVIAADSRTNAGADQVSTFRKLHVFERPGDRFLVLAVIGNLSLAQTLLTELRASIDRQGRFKIAGPHLLEAPNFYDAARHVGLTIRALEAQDGPALSKHGVTFDVSVILGGQIGKERHRLFQVYSAGNFIEASDDAPYFQIGERKYGKPILDATVTGDLALRGAVKTALLSFDMTIQNNATVGLPVDLIALPKDQLRPVLQRRFSAEDAYWTEIRRRWQDGVKGMVAQLPDLDVLAQAGGALIRLPPR